MKSVHKYLTERLSTVEPSEYEDNVELMKAVLSGDIQKVKEEFKNNPNSNPNMRDSQGRTLLYMCSQPDIAKLLIDKGADVDDTDNDWGDSALAHASYYHREALMKVLISKGANPNIPHDPKNKNKDEDGGLTPLFFMASHDKLEMVELLIKKGADVNHRAVDGSTPLMSCFMWKALAKNSAKYLISKGADVTLKDKVGNTALTYAFRRTKDAKVLAILNH